MTPRLLNRQQAANYCGVCVNTFVTHIATQVHAVAIGAKRLWDIRKLDQWIDTLATGITEPSQADWLARLDRDDCTN